MRLRVKHRNVWHKKFAFFPKKFTSNFEGDEITYWIWLEKYEWYYMNTWNKHYRSKFDKSLEFATKMKNFNKEKEPKGDIVPSSRLDVAKEARERAEKDFHKILAETLRRRNG